jgi:hypothetical protein
MKYKFFAAVVALAAAVAPAESYADDTKSKSDQMADLDNLLKQFKDARTGAKMHAYQAAARADQYHDNSWSDYKRALKEQEMYDQQVKLLDEKIAELEARRAALQK